jgi:hypothetical protein
MSPAWPKFFLSPTVRQNNFHLSVFLCWLPCSRSSLTCSLLRWRKRPLRVKVSTRVMAYPSPDQEKKETWRREWFEPTLDRLSLRCLSWEEIINFIDADDPTFGPALADFYAQCLTFNRLQEPERSPSSQPIYRPSSPWETLITADSALRSEPTPPR